MLPASAARRVTQSGPESQFRQAGDDLVHGSEYALFPAGAFTNLNGNYYFAGMINGVLLHAALVPLGGKTYAFVATAALTPATSNPVAVSLTIGDDGGASAVNASFSFIQLMVAP